MIEKENPKVATDDKAEVWHTIPDAVNRVILSSPFVVSIPRNNAPEPTASFVATRDIIEGDAVYISHVDKEKNTVYLTPMPAQWRNGNDG